MWPVDVGASSRRLPANRGKPTMGFEPMTPALRERCSGQLSYVGVGGECSRGRAFSMRGFRLPYACRAWLQRPADWAGLDTQAARRCAAVAALPLGPHVRDALRT